MISADAARLQKGLSDEAGNRLSGRSEASSEDGEWELVSRLGIASSPSSLQEHKNARGQVYPFLEID